MLGGEFWIGIASLAIGIVATWIVSRYFFLKSTKRSLSIFVQSVSQLFAGVSPDVRSKLNIAYQGVEVDDLQEVQFIVANTGHRAIRDVISPLRLKINEASVLVDAAILHVQPKGRTVEVKVAPSEVSFPFSLLNPNDFFIARLLIKGRVAINKSKFEITAEDLPPAIETIWATPELVVPDLEHKPDYKLLFPLPLIAILTWGHVFLVLSVIDSGHVPFFSLRMAAVLVVGFMAIVYFIGAIMTFVGIFVGDFSFPPKRKFVVPHNLIRSRFYQLALEHEGKI